MRGSFDDAGDPSLSDAGEEGAQHTPQDAGKIDKAEKVMKKEKPLDCPRREVATSVQALRRERKKKGRYGGLSKGYVGKRGKAPLTFITRLNSGRRGVSSLFS